MRLLSQASQGDTGDGGPVTRKTKTNALWTRSLRFMRWGSDDAGSLTPTSAVRPRGWGRGAWSAVSFSPLCLIFDLFCTVFDHSATNTMVFTTDAQDTRCPETSEGKTPRALEPSPQC